MVQQEMILDRGRQRLVINGQPYSEEWLIEQIAKSDDERERSILAELSDFLTEWFAPGDTMTVRTSGSTGTPKPIEVSKERMMRSAVTTCEYLHLKAGDTALLCMPVRYIAGRMMVVRALVSGMRLVVVPPDGHPLRDISMRIDFAAMIPLQVYNSLENETEALRRVGKLIIGGGPVDDKIAAAMSSMSGEVFATYGMTETLSHIAMRRINGENASERYYPLRDVTLSLSADDTLVIDAPRVCESTLTTNDVVRLYPDGGFTITGRRDNIINSGGIKIQIEEVEKALKQHIQVPFAITAVPDGKLGEAVTLLLQSCNDIDVDGIYETLPRYWRPRHTLYISSLPLTATGKTDRAACRRLASDKCAR